MADVEVVGKADAEAKKKEIGPTYSEHLSKMNDADTKELHEVLASLHKYSWVIPYLNTKKYAKILSILKTRIGG